MICCTMYWLIFYFHIIFTGLWLSILLESNFVFCCWRRENWTIVICSFFGFLAKNVRHSPWRSSSIHAYFKSSQIKDSCSHFVNARRFCTFSTRCGGFPSWLGIFERSHWIPFKICSYCKYLYIITMYDFHNSTDTLKFWTEKRAINKTILLFIIFWWNLVKL